MHLTPEIMAAAYEFLRALPPFRRWKLSYGDAVEFHVIRTTDRYGDCDVDADSVRIRASAAKVSHTDTLVRLMAHEMCHIRAFRQGESSEHGRLWRVAAAKVCKEHGFDPKEF